LTKYLIEKTQKHPFFVTKNTLYSDPKKVTKNTLYRDPKKTLFWGDILGSTGLPARAVLRSLPLDQWWRRVDHTVPRPVLTVL
jgi:hypothetical protein